MNNDKNNNAVIETLNIYDNNLNAARTRILLPTSKASSSFSFASHLMLSNTFNDS